MSQKELKREIGLFGLSANIVNMVIGAGIFALPAVIAVELGSASIFAYLFCGLLVALVMLCFAEVGSKITDSGGAYAYIKVAFGPYFGFITMILFTLSGIAADAAVANAVAGILGSIHPVFQSAIGKIALFVALFGTLAAFNVVGVKEGIGIVKLFTVAKVFPLFALILFSWGNVNFSFLAIDTTFTFSEIGQASLLLFFAFQGAESALSISGEVKNPQKTIPKAIFLGIAFILIFYMSIQTVTQGVLGSELPNFKENPLSQVAGVVFGPIGFTLITIGAGVSMLGNLSSEVLSMPRVIFQASKDKLIPIEVFSRIHQRFATPYVAVITYAALGFIFAVSGGFRQLAIISNVSILLVYLGVVLSLIFLRRRERVKIQGFRVPGGYLVPIAAAIIILWLLSHMAIEEYKVMGFIIAGLSIIYYLQQRFKK